MSWRDDLRRANETLDWIEQRQGPLKPTSYARIETTVGQVKAMAEGQDDDARISEIRENHGPTCQCSTPWECDAKYLLARLDALASEASAVARENETLIEEVKAAGEQIAALAAERDAWQALAEDREARLKQANRDTTTMTKAAHDYKKKGDAAVARLAAAEAALSPCTLALEYRDGVTCREERDRGVCLNHRVIQGLRVHAVTADRLELENRALRRQVRASYGIIHDGLHGGKPTDPEHQEACEMPSCRNARAVLAGSREQAASVRGSLCCHCDGSGKEHDGSDCLVCDGSGCYTHRRPDSLCETCNRIRYSASRRRGE